MTLLKITNWDKWQSYRKDRGTPPWIKVHRSIMTNPEWSMLSDAEKGQLVSLWIVAADKQGELPDNAKIIRKISMLDDEPDIEKFIEYGFIERVENSVVVNVTSSGCQHDAPETETETETETEADVAKIKSQPFPLEKIKAYWNTTNLTPFRTYSPERERAIKVRTEEIKKAYPDQAEESVLDIWTNFIDWMNESNFLTNQTDWKKVDIDWILKPNNFAKILDGKYESKEVA
jgi:hypothetical protein